MDAVSVLLETIADTDAPVLLRGEPGVGKDFVARAIHAAARSRRGPLIKVNSRAIAPALLESELFGHEKGAFAGAHRRKPGRLEYANGGTIYLDEVTHLPASLQASFVQALQERSFRRLGSHQTMALDTRVIAATTRNLEEGVARGTFREDLYERLSAVAIRIPPLRERPAMIPVLAARFLARFNEQYGRVAQLAPATLARFAEYSWPGNVGELEEIVRRLVVWPDAHDALPAATANGNHVPVEPTRESCGALPPASTAGSGGASDVAQARR